MGGPAKPFVIGLTGGIGSGKSAAAEAFGRLGATVVDTDLIAHALTARGGAALDGVRQLFGDGAIGADGAMDRAAVRARVFEAPAERARLEGLLHPMIREESRRQIESATGPYVVHVVPLLVESRDPRRGHDRVAVVDCPEEVQLERVRRRSGLAEAQVRRIMEAQASRTARLAAADDVIDNAGSLDALHARVRELHAAYVRMAAAGGTSAGA